MLPFFVCWARPSESAMIARDLSSLSEEDTKMRKYLTIVAAAGIVLACVSGAQAVDIETVPVGNPGNAGELSGEGAATARTASAVRWTTRTTSASTR